MRKSEDRPGRLLAGAAAASLGAALGLSWIRFRRELRAARARLASGSRVVGTPGGPIEYAERGEGPPLLLVHGAGGGWDQGLDLGAPLVAAGFRAIAPSRFGYLRTPLPADASAEAQADAHARLLDALDVPRAAILGASAGAPSAMQFALRHPDRCRALVLVAPAVWAPRPGGAPPVKTPAGLRLLFDTALRSDFVFWVAIRAARPVAIRTILGTPLRDFERASDAEKARVRTMLDHILPVSPRRLGLLNDAAVTSALPRYDLERIAAPTLVVGARDDLYGTWEGGNYTAAHVPGARLVGFPDGGHLLVGHEREANEAIAQFLR